MSCHRCGEVLVGHHAIVIHIEGAELEHCLRIPWHTRVSCGPEMALIPPFALSWSTSRFVSLPIGQEKLPSGFHQVGSRGICQLDIASVARCRARVWQKLQVPSALQSYESSRCFCVNGVALCTAYIAFSFRVLALSCQSSAGSPPPPFRV